MATVINNPNSPEGTQNSSASMLIGIAMFILVLILLWVFAVPFLTGRGEPGTTTINNEQPAQEMNQNDSGETGTIPEQIDINIDGNLQTE